LLEPIGYSIALALIAITISIGGILLGLGYAIDDKKLKDLAKMELYTAVINGVILGVLIAAFSSNGIVAVALNGATNNVSQGYSCPSQMEYNSALCFAYNYVVGVSQINVYNANYPTIFDSTVTLLVPLAAMYAGLSIINSMSFNLGVMSLGISGSMKPILTSISYAIDALTIALMSIEIQGFLLMFISASAMSILMPIGITLRCFYFTRRLGGTILAITIGLFAVLPMTYVLDATIINSYAVSFNPSSLTPTMSNATGLQGNLLNEVSNYQSGASNSIGAFNYITGLVSGFISSVQQFLSGLANFVGIIVVQAFLMPAFSIILTMVSMRELARILGSEVNLNKFSII
jgi:hypothetical protein